MMAHGRFGTAINCMDGGIQFPAINWIKNIYGHDIVDSGLRRNDSARFTLWLNRYLPSFVTASPRLHHRKRDEQYGRTK